MSNILQKFVQHGYQVHPEALRILQDSNPDDIDEIIHQVLTNLDETTLVVGPEHIQSARSPLANGKGEINGCTPRYSVMDGIAGSVGDAEQICIRVLKDVPPKCTGKYEEFAGYFRNRYAKLSGIIKKRVSPRAISGLQRSSDGRSATSIIGMVSSVSTTSKGDSLVTLEDETGEAKVLLKGRHNIMLDEVIGATGFQKNGLFIAKDITYPELSITRKSHSGDGAVIFISDLHFGSREFLEDAWRRFVGWLNSEIGDDSKKTLAEKVKYIVVAGDLVDGVGIYPEQEKELSISNIYRQYEAAAEGLQNIPHKIKIIISPGNHDAVRLAEPQPKLPSEMTSLFSNNTTFVGNPAYVEIENLKVLIYHGCSIWDFVKTFNISYKEPQKAMAEMLKRRHLAPVYGGEVPIAPEREDYLVIDEIPDIFHSGHVHTVGIDNYRGVTLINSGAWQSQTEYQQRRGIIPVPGEAPLVDLGTMEVCRLRFEK